MSPELSGQNHPDLTTLESSPSDRNIATWGNLGNQLSWTDQGVVERADTAPSEPPTETPLEQSESSEPTALETMIAHAEADGYQPQKFGEHTVLSINQDGKIRIESQYRELWQKAADQDPDFYNNPANSELSTALWSLGNIAMFQDLNPDHTPDRSSFRDVYNHCFELKSLAKNPEYDQHINHFITELEELGQSGDFISAAYDIAGDKPLSSTENPITINPDLSAELDRQQSRYGQLNQRYAEIRSSGTLDSDELTDLAAAYHDFGDFADSQDRFDEVQKLLDHLGAITSTFD